MTVKFSKDHEWINAADANAAVVGITDFMVENRAIFDDVAAGLVGVFQGIGPLAGRLLPAMASALAKIEQVSRGWRGWLLPGWGNPEPSWLRTHPATHERIARLAELAAHPPSLPPWQADTFGFQAPLRAPRWRPGGLWR